MKIASYTATRAGYAGFGNRMIRKRFGGSFFSEDGTASHTEIVFEPGDGVDHLMPDKTTAPDADGAVWCASAAATDRIPEWAPRRGGKIGGVRYKRIVLDPGKWELEDYPHPPLQVAGWFCDNEGEPYDWTMIFGFVVWVFALFLRRGSKRRSCSSAAASAGGYERAEFFHPELLRLIFRNRHRVVK